MTFDRFKALRKEAIRKAAEVGLPQAVKYLRRNGVYPTRHMIAEMKFVAIKLKRAERLMGVK